MVTDDVKVMPLRRDGECVCGAFLPRGTRAGWHRTLRIVLCLRCLHVDAPPEPVDIGRPGASLEREHARRVAAWERRVRGKHPRLGGLLLRLWSPSRTTEAFAIGAAGEKEVAERLQRGTDGSVLFLFNRRLGTTRAAGDIDVIAVAPSGVWVIDPKKYVGRRVRATRAGDAFVVDGRRRPKLSQSMRRQVEAVTAGVRSGPEPTVAVSAAYCFVDADLPWGRLVVDGVPALGIRTLLKRINEPGALGAGARARLHGDLARRFPPA